MSKSDPGWDWFAPPAPPDNAQRLAVARAFARAFSGADGDLALAHLRSLTLDRCLGPDASDAALRCLEGQRLLAAHILSLVERGRDGSLYA
ncbi:protein of unknown function [Magnetospirillum gryphiswaldense MSR-1 v2]|uniref:Bbp19-like phage domain-containing protein n=1 Tax=Magnetospirillum gryphiswaldense (strain DSM 6361 / JCM 21280 / NBRC 15271 / MSR-1) TaxID=431944 RepID=V6F8E4_MAGGM|nr:hypothetical protein [Magnetospirillum gryphiswaldense]CDL00888.1 protein of unknown function [Magnetospirillum gryphiswaldense MSR-1 v2]